MIRLLKPFKNRGNRLNIGRVGPISAAGRGPVPRSRGFTRRAVFLQVCKQFTEGGIPATKSLPDEEIRAETVLI
jgi:hypothetical protein